MKPEPRHISMVLRAGVLVSILTTIILHILNYLSIKTPVPSVAGIYLLASTPFIALLLIILDKILDKDYLTAVLGTILVLMALIHTYINILRTG